METAEICFPVFKDSSVHWSLGLAKLNQRLLLWLYLPNWAYISNRALRVKHNLDLMHTGDSGISDQVQLIISITDIF